MMKEASKPEIGTNFVDLSSITRKSNIKESIFTFTSKCNSLLRFFNFVPPYAPTIN